MRLYIRLTTCALAALSFLAAAAQAQEPPQVPAVPPEQAAPAAAEEGAPDVLEDEQLQMGIQESFVRRLRLHKPEVRPDEITSLLFTPWQHALLEEAKRLFTTRPPEQHELDDPNTPGARGIREISVGGIVYKTPEQWTVWLNGQRIAPDALPDEIIDIDVTERYVQLKWFDSYTNLIYPVRLRAHQRFNLDSRMFLPGAGSGAL